MDLRECSRFCARSHVQIVGRKVGSRYESPLSHVLLSQTPHLHNLSSFACVQYTPRKHLAHGCVWGGGHQGQLWSDSCGLWGNNLLRVGVAKAQAQGH
jgi:hypothetical protein